jgi:cytochrome c1
MLLIASIPAQAALYKGQKVYKKVCMECHTGGESFIGERSQFEWEEYTVKKGKKLAETHLESSKFKEEKEYKKYKKFFEGKKYKKNIKHLKEFLMEYASDSGNVAACS